MIILAYVSLIGLLSFSARLVAEQSEIWSCREFSGDYEFSLALDGPYLFETKGRRWLRHGVVRDDKNLVVAFDVWGLPESMDGRNVGSIILLLKDSGDFLRYRLDTTSVYLAVRASCTFEGRSTDRRAE